jgi:hypothetical protein
MIQSNKTYVGVVEDNNDPKKLGRVRARVMQVFENIPVEEIPWAFPWKDLNGNQFNVPDKGKVVMVVFDNGDKNNPEYIYADHYNINLEKKLQSLSETDYITMKSLIFDHRTQIYVNESEGLKIDHKYNNINLTEGTIDINLKDNNRNLNLGDATADQQAILGNHWLDWFDEFVDNLLGSQAGPFLGNLGAPVIPNPSFISCLLKYKALRDPVFLSHHVNIVDNNKVSTVGLEKREDESLLGDLWESTVTENNLTEKTNEDFKPVEGPKTDSKEDPTINSATSSNNESTTNTNTTPTQNGTTQNTDITQNGATQNANEQSQTLTNDQTATTSEKIEPLSSVKSNPLIEKLVKFLKSKNYEVYDQPNILNLVAMRNKDSGQVTNKFDDKLYVFYRKSNDNWQILEYEISSVPGPRPNGSVKGAPIMAYAQFVDKLRLDTYTRQVNQFVDKSGKVIPSQVIKIKSLVFKEVAIYNNDLDNKYNYKLNPEILRAGRVSFWIRPAQVLPQAPQNPEKVWLSGDGSQVFKSRTQYNQFIKLCEEHYKTKNSFTYAICRKSEFDDFIPTT